MIKKRPGFIFENLNKLSSRFSRAIAIAVVVVVVVVSGHTVSAQVTPPLLTSLSTVSVPQPDNLGDFINNKVAAIRLGKTLFWDEQLGSDGQQSCASCHFHAGADNRSKNQINPGLLRVNADGTPNPDYVFNVGGAPNYQLTPGDYPFHKLSNPNDPNTVVSDSNDITSSQGVFATELTSDDQVKPVPDPVFNVAGRNVRQVALRNAPTVINSVFNFRNFWDGKAQNIFNGVNSIGLRDPNASVVKANTQTDELTSVQVSLNNSSLASQAVGPPLSSVELSSQGRTFQDIGQNFLGNKGLPRVLAKSILSIRPLGKQLVDPEDSVLGADSSSPQPGLDIKTYQELIEDAFKPEWWQSDENLVQIDDKGQMTFVKKSNLPSSSEQFTLTQYNFPLFFGLAIQMYESTLISDQTPLDLFLNGNTSALTDPQKRGLDLFEGKAKCIGCHKGAEFTAASVRNVSVSNPSDSTTGRIREIPTTPNKYFDNGFLNIGVTPTLQDLGVGGNDPLGNPLSETRLAQKGKFQQLLGTTPNLTVPSDATILADGSFKVPGLRNVELTAPYFHNGGYLTLQQVVELYNRGGDFSAQSILSPLGLTDAEKSDLVAFLTALTDERVRLEKAPFDHPQLFVPNGHPGNTTSVTDDGTGKATDNLLEIPAVGRNGGKGTSNFLQ